MLYAKPFLTKYEFKNHKKVFSKKFKKENLPLYISMQIIYGDSLRNFLKTSKIKQTVIETELALHDEMIKKIIELYGVESKADLIFDDHSKTDLYINKKIADASLKFIKSYKKRSRMHEIFKKNKIDLVYVY